MKDRFLNGWSTKNLIQRLITDERCPVEIRNELRLELPAFDALRRSQAGRQSPTQLSPMSGFIMRVEGLLMAGIRNPQELKLMVGNVARVSAIHLGSDDISSFVDSLLSPKEEGDQRR